MEPRLLQDSHLFMKTSLRSFGYSVAFSVLTLGLARGAVFDFSYTLGDTVVASGSLIGTQNGAFVENITGVSLSFNGSPVAGTIFAAKFDTATFEYLAGPI